MKKSLVTLIGVLASCAAASAADLPSRKAAPQPILSPVPVWTWSGLYVGVNGGGFINDSRLTTGIGSAKASGGGFLVGGTLGYNWQMSNGFVLGVETDMDYRSSTTFSTPLSASSTTRDGFLGTARGRIGYGWDRLLVYATGGLAVGNTIAPNSLAIPAGNYFGVRSGTNGGLMAGWTAGAGLEYAISDNWSIKGEYLYADLGKKTLVYVSPFNGGVNGLVPTQTREHIIRAGVNYRFNWAAPGPVLARY